VLGFDEVLPQGLSLSSPNSVRAVLDRYDVRGRLQYLREFIWRGGTLELRVGQGADGQTLNVWYDLRAEWPAAVLVPADATGTSPGLTSWRTPVVEGRWLRGTAGYELRVGIDLCMGSAIYIRSHGFVSHVPFVGRPVDQVEHALNAELTSYANRFLDHFQPVTRAQALAAEELHRLQLEP
jgi:hypothetical protein